MIRSKFSRFSLRRSMEAQTIKEKMCLIEEVKEPADTIVEYKAQLRFERHTSVYKLFLIMRGVWTELRILESSLSLVSIK